ncbi:LysR family transcriptional regulator [Pseudaminobacter soli (ex Li et al. 2025)]|uniref:LysR family transcriptional regulator n=1 Tax=Pseudaminobacter soli (ex Li et al. 2025) TaxID=1295366 RepID=A0A2P7SD68_9HYPH|nr:LysR family transcriptional regulator [Mesorhizobium soli]PSJ60452.1 LysR family transcriptional regulator [Mesorhizobium soli]
MNSLRGIDLNLLVVLDALLAERHVSRAAVRLNMSQPAVSHALGRLRELLGDPLLVRRGGGLVPTTRALELARPLADALTQVRAVLGPVHFDPASQTHAFRLAMSDYGAGLVLPRLVRKLRREAPGIDLIVTQSSRDAMTAQVSDGDIDLALGVFPMLPTRLQSQVLFEERFVCLLDRSTLATEDGLSFDAYMARPHALVAVRGEADTEIDDRVTALGGRRRVALILPHWKVAPGLIAGTDLVLTVARRSLESVAPDERLTIVDAPFAIPSFSFVQIWHERREADPGHRWLREAVAEAAGGS